MREIKFRGRILENFGDNKGNVIIQKGTLIYGGIVFDTDRVWIDTEYYGQIIVDKETVGQYTGLKDENGKEIYEGDIVEFSYDVFNGNFDTKIGKGIVKFIAGAFQIKTIEIEDIDNIEYFTLYSVNEDDIEVIGNIYDNPELLESEDK